MNLRVLLLVNLCTFHLLPGAVGCMDTSHHLTTSIDRKDLHYVSCDCSCDSTTLLRTHGTCILCGHLHLPREWIIMKHGKQVATTLQYRATDRQDQTSLSTTTQYLIKEMVKQYKQRQSS